MKVSSIAFLNIAANMFLHVPQWLAFLACPLTLQELSAALEVNIVGWFSG